jgi:hypothetical protein
MIPQDKIREIVKRLLEKSRSNQVNWQREPSRKMNDGTTIEELVVRFPESSIAVRYWSPPTEPDYISIHVLNKGGVKVETIYYGDNDEDWPLASDLFREAERFVLGWDKVLTDIESAIGREGPIGLPPERTSKDPH